MGFVLTSSYSESKSDSGLKVGFALFLLTAKPGWTVTCGSGMTTFSTTTSGFFFYYITTVVCAFTTGSGGKLSFLDLGLKTSSSSSSSNRAFLF